MTFLVSIRRFLDALVHPSARYDAMADARHRLFIGARLFGSFALLASFPIYVALRGAPGMIEVTCFAWLITPILISYYLSRTGQYERAHVLSSLSLSTLVTVVAINTGGVSSFAAIWLVAVPIEAALSSSRRVVRFSAILSLACAGVLIAFATSVHAGAPAFRHPVLC